MGSALTAFGVVFVAEFGDRTQLLVATLAARHALAPVLAGLAAGYAVTNVLAVLLGGLLGSVVSGRTVQVVSGLVFLGFALWTVRGDDGDDDVDAHADAVGLRLVLAVAGAIIVSELGDKSMLATATVAADGDPFGTWVGATLGIMAAGGIGAIAGNALGDRIDPVWLRRGAAALFALFGALLLLGIA